MRGGREKEEDGGRQKDRERKRRERERDRENVVRGIGEWDFVGDRLSPAARRSL